jgi:hypothetical protein
MVAISLPAALGEADDPSAVGDRREGGGAAPRYSVEFKLPR